MLCHAWTLPQNSSCRSSLIKLPKYRTVSTHSAVHAVVAVRPAGSSRAAYKRPLPQLAEAKQLLAWMRQQGQTPVLLQARAMRAGHAGRATAAQHSHPQLQAARVMMTVTMRMHQGAARGLQLLLPRQSLAARGTHSTAAASSSCQLPSRRLPPTLLLQASRGCLSTSLPLRLQLPLPPSRRRPSSSRPPTGVAAPHW